MTPVDPGDDDDLDLADLTLAIESLKHAQDALLTRLMGINPKGERERFLFHVGVAKGRLMRIAERINKGERQCTTQRGGAPAPRN